MTSLGRVVLEAAATIVRNPLRSSLAALAVAAAVATMIAIEMRLQKIAPPTASLRAAR